MRLQSAIFDMDGTLLDSMPTWRELGPTFLKEAGITATPEQDRMLHILADCDVIPYLREVCFRVCSVAWKTFYCKSRSL